VQFSTRAGTNVPTFPKWNRYPAISLLLAFGGNFDLDTSLFAQGTE